MSGLSFNRSLLLAAVMIGFASAPAFAGEGGGGGGGGGGGDSSPLSMIPKPQRGGATGGMRDPYTGNTRVVVRDPAGATDITTYGPDGTILSQGRKPAPKKVARPAGPRPLFKGERQIGNYTVQTWLNPDGSASRITIDAEGREVGRTNFSAGERANSVVADAQRGRR